MGTDADAVRASLERIGITGLLIWTLVWALPGWAQDAPEPTPVAAAVPAASTAGLLLGVLALLAVAAVGLARIRIIAPKARVRRDAV